jgi:multicomponent Na+:H+ antiporter subunit D
VTTTSHLPSLLFIVPFLAALVAAAGGWLLAGVARWVALGALVVTAALAVVSVPLVLTTGPLVTHLGGWPPPIGIEVLLDPLSACVAALVAVVALIVVAGSMREVREELPGQQTAYYASVLLMLSGLLGIVITGDLFNLFVQIELASLSAYALVATGGPGAPRAGVTSLIIGSFGASIYLAGVGFLYAATGTLNMADVAERLAAAEPRLVAVGGVLIVAGLGVKMALFPLHMWMPAAYALSPSAAASLMAPLVTKVSAYALIRVLFWVFGGETQVVTRLLLDLVALAGAAAIVAGGIMALVETDLRRLLAYSSIGQMGVVALGVGVANAPGMSGAVLHIANDALMKGALFVAACIALLRFGVREVSDLSRLRGRAPWTSAAMAVAGLSLIGIPPLGGFFGKWYVLNGTLADGRWALTAAFVVGSLATVGYVLRLIESLFFSAPSGERDRREGSRPALVACGLLTILVILIGVGNERIVTSIVTPALPGGLR